MVSNWGIYLTHFNYRRRPGYRIYLTISAKYCSQLSFKYLPYALVIKTNSNSAPECKIKTSNEHNHCTVQPFDTAFRGPQEASKLLNGAAAPAPPCLGAVQWLGVGLVIERSLVRLPAEALSSQLGQLSLPSLRGR